MCRNRVVCACVLLLSAAGLSAPAGAQPPNPELTRILDLMEARQKQAGIVRIKAEGTRLVPKGARSERFPVYPGEAVKTDPPSDETTELRQDMTFDFQTPRYRQLKSEKLNSGFSSWLGVADGKKRYGVKSELGIEELDASRPSDIGATIGGGKANIFNWDMWPYFVSAGFPITRERQPYHLDAFALPLDRENLFLHGRQTVDGVACVTLRTFPYGQKGAEQFFEYAVGRDDGAVRKLIDWRSGRNDGQITITYRPVAERVVPTGWVSDWHQPRGVNRLFQREQMTVKATERGSELASRFALVPADGARVTEKQYPPDAEVLRPGDEKVAQYRVDPSGDWVKVSADGRDLRSNRTLLWLALVAAGGVCVFVCALRRFRRSASHTTP
jgi:hypothetical protein